GVGVQRRPEPAAIGLATGAAKRWTPAPNSRVEGLSVRGNTVYAAGQFNSIGGQTRVGAAALDGVTGLAKAWNPNAGQGSPSVGSVLADGSVVYIGGSFVDVNGQPRGYVAAVDATLGGALPRNPSVPAHGVQTTALSGSTIYLGGTFSAIRGYPTPSLAAEPVPPQLYGAAPSHSSDTQIVPLVLGGAHLAAGAA